MMTLRIIAAARHPAFPALGLALGLALTLACGNGKAQAPGQDQAKGAGASASAPGAASATGTAAFPAETRVVIGASVPRIAASPLARRILADLLGRDREAEKRLVDLLAHCKIDPGKDIDSVTIGMAQGQDLALLVRGRIDEKSLVECVRSESTAAGGTFAGKTIAGRTVNAATSKEGGQNVYFTFEGSEAEHTVLVSLSETWLAKILDPKAPKIGSAPDMATLLGRVPGEAAVWGTGMLPPGVGQNLVKLTDGQVTQPAQSVAFEASFDGGLSATVRLDMKGATDAEKLAAFAKGQLDWLAVAAQRYSIGPLMAKIQIVSEQSSVKFSARLDEADVKILEAALAKSAPAISPKTADKQAGPATPAK